MLGEVTFTTNLINYTFAYDAKTLSIQANKDNSNQIEKIFTKSQLEQFWPYFSKFPSIQAIFEHLISIEEQGKMLCDEMGNDYLLLFEAKDKNDHAYTIEIPLGNALESISFTSVLLSRKNSILRLDYDFNNDNFTTECSETSKNNSELNIELKPTMTFKRKRHQSVMKIVNVGQLMENAGENLGFLDEKESEMVKEWICDEDFENDSYYKLMYKPSEGEDNELKAIKTFYMEAPLLLLIKTTEGCRFGGFTSVGWDIPCYDTEECKEDLYNHHRRIQA